MGFDARLVARGLGISTALRGLASALSDAAEIVWFGDAELAPSGVHEVRRPMRPYPAADTRLSWREVNRAGLDVFHFAGNSGWTHPGPVPAVLTIHDLIYMKTGFTRRSWRQRIGHRYLAHNVPRAARAATRIVVPSMATASVLGKVVRTQTPPLVIPWGIEPPAGWSPARCTSSPPYVVAFAAPDPRKRLDVVLEAWRRLRQDGVELWLLGGAGIPRDMRTDVARETHGGVRVFGYLSSVELWSVTSGALALLYPTNDEGFGFPVLEGMAAGTAVITGLCAGTRELGGDAILPIDPGAPVDSITHWVRRLESEPGFRADTIARGRRRASHFTWGRAAGRYLECYRDSIRARE